MSPAVVGAERLQRARPERPRDQRGRQRVLRRAFRRPRTRRHQRRPPCSSRPGNSQRRAVPSASTAAPKRRPDTPRIGRRRACPNTVFISPSAAKPRRIRLPDRQHIDQIGIAVVHACRRRTERAPLLTRRITPDASWRHRAALDEGGALERSPSHLVHAVERMVIAGRGWLSETASRSLRPYSMVSPAKTGPAISSRESRARADRPPLAARPAASAAAESTISRIQITAVCSPTQRAEMRTRRASSTWCWGSKRRRGPVVGGEGVAAGKDVADECPRKFHAAARLAAAASSVVPSSWDPPVQHLVANFAGPASGRLLARFSSTVARTRILCPAAAA